MSTMSCPKCNANFSIQTIKAHLAKCGKEVKAKGQGGDWPVEYTVLKEGKGIRPKQGQKVTVSYVGTLANGTEFDANKKFQFTLGAGQVIKGWDQGVAKMRLGEKARFVIPPSHGYGAQKSGPIPANSTLTFEVELTGVGK